MQNCVATEHELEDILRERGIDRPIFTLGWPWQLALQKQIGELSGGLTTRQEDTAREMLEAIVEGAEGRTAPLRKHRARRPRGRGSMMARNVA